jgi:hypothetical protein
MDINKNVIQKIMYCKCILLMSYSTEKSTVGNDLVKRYIISVSQMTTDMS